MNAMKSAVFAAVFLMSVSSANAQELPIQIDLCEVLRNPETYNHKLIEVKGLVTRGFEDFTLKAEGCSLQQNSLWLEFGGKLGSDTIYCCGDTNNQGMRKEPLKIDGIATSLTQDLVFDQFQKITNQGDYGIARATIIGRFFAGEKQNLPKGVRWGGYGHFGMFSLLVIQKVTSVQAK